MPPSETVSTRTGSRGNSTDSIPNIPPYAENWEIIGHHAGPRAITLYGLSPHMHLRGKDIDVHRRLSRTAARSRS